MSDDTNNPRIFPHTYAADGKCEHCHEGPLHSMVGAMFCYRSPAFVAYDKARPLADQLYDWDAVRS